MNHRDYPIMTIEAVIENDYSGLVALSGNLLGVTTNPISQEWPPYSRFTFSLRQLEPNSEVRYAASELILPEYLSHEELGYISRQCLHSLLLTAELESSVATLYGAVTPMQPFPRMLASRITLQKNLRIGRFSPAADLRNRAD